MFINDYFITMPVISLSPLSLLFPFPSYHYTNLLIFLFPLSLVPISLCPSSFIRSVLLTGFTLAPEIMSGLAALGVEFTKVEAFDATHLVAEKVVYGTKKIAVTF